MEIVLRDLGAALVGATFFALVVDYFLAQHLADEAQRLNQAVQDGLSSDVSQAIKKIEERQAMKLLQSLMPEKVFEQIDNHVIKTPFLRRGLEWTVILEPGPDGDHIKMKTTREFTVVNSSPHEHNYMIDATSDIEPDLEEKYPDFSNFTRLVVIRSGGQEASLEADLQKFVEKRDDEVLLRRQLTMEPNESVKLLIEDVDLARAEDYLNMLTPDMAEGFEVRVLYHALGSEYTVRLVPLHPDTALFQRSLEAPGVQIWKLQSGVLPYQGVSIYWRRRGRIVQEYPSETENIELGITIPNGGG